MDVYTALLDASSQDPAKAAQAHTNLQAATLQQGAYTEIINIAATKTAPLNVRRIAIIQFKNVAASNWRAKSLFTDQNREIVRQRCVTFLDEEDDIIAQCSAVIIAKIFRVDTIKAWPGLINGLVNVIEQRTNERLNSENPSQIGTLMLKRALSVLNQIIKEVGSVRLPSGLEFMSQIISETFAPLNNTYQSFSHYVANSLSPQSINIAQTAADMEIIHIAYKCLSKIVVWLWIRFRTRTDASEKHAAIANFFKDSISRFNSVFNIRMNLMGRYFLADTPKPNAVGTRSIDFLTRHVRAFGKFFRKLQQPDLPRFTSLPGCGELILFYWDQVCSAIRSPPGWISDGVDAMYPTQILLQGMVLFKENVSQWTPNKKANADNGNQVLTKDFVAEAVDILLNHFIPLKPDDLQKWNDDSEEWINEEDKDSEAWEYEVRPCAERVLMTLSARYPQYVVPLLISTFNQVMKAPVDTKMESVMRKEAIYCAVGRCYYQLHNAIGFDQWLDSGLSVEVRQTHPYFRILKRRIAWVFGEFSQELASSPARCAKVWEILLFLIRDQSESSDMAVRLSAALSLRHTIDIISFDVNVFNPFIAGIVGGLMQLMAEVDTLESKRKIADTLNNVIERSEMKIVPFMGIITEPIPQLWASAGDDYLFKAALLILMKQLIQASKDQSANLQHMVVPLVQEAMSPAARLRIDEDGLSLWLVALRNATTVHATVPGSPALVNLVPGAISLLKDNLDLLGTALSIIEGYILLDVAASLQPHAFQLHEAFAQCLQVAVSTNARDVLVTLNLLLQIAPPSLWAEPMHQTGLFKQLLESILSDKGPTANVLAQIHVFARMIIQDPPIFLQLFQASSRKPDDDLDKLLDVWWRRFDNMAEPRHRKLTAMAMGCLVGAGVPQVLKRLPGETINLWLDVLGEMKEALGTTDENPLTLYWRDNGSSLPEALLHDAEDTLEEARRRKVYTRDPVQSTLLTAFLAAKLQEATQTTVGGPAVFNSYISKTDPLVLEQLQKALAS